MFVFRQGLGWPTIGLIEKETILKKFSRMAAMMPPFSQAQSDTPAISLLRPVIVASSLVALAASPFFVHPAAAQDPSTFVIAASDGYGVGDCLAEGGSCGRIEADAWCVAA